MDGYTPAPSSPVGAVAQSLSPRMIKGLQADYVPASWDGENTSGLKPFGGHVLVRMDECAQTTAGGILMVDDQVERMSLASESGCIYAIGNKCFVGWLDEDKPQIGERVYVEKYAGVHARGRDGALYRIMTDTCIYAGLAEPDADAQPERVGL